MQHRCCGASVNRTRPHMTGVASVNRSRPHVASASYKFACRAQAYMTGALATVVLLDCCLKTLLSVGFLSVAVLLPQVMWLTSFLCDNAVKVSEVPQV